MALERKKTLNVFKEAEHAWGSYDDYPVGPSGTDPMPHLSRNRVAQPFFLISEADHVLIHMAGAGAIEFREPLERMELTPGDAVYIPAGTPSRVLPAGEVLQLRLKAEPPARESVAWYCERCGACVDRRALPAGIAQAEYHAAVLAFNATSRTCACGAVHAVAELGDTAWPAVAAALREET
jgi:hypothetical protein